MMIYLQIQLQACSQPLTRSLEGGVVQLDKLPLPPPLVSHGRWHHNNNNHHNNNHQQGEDVAKGPNEDVGTGRSRLRWP